MESDAPRWNLAQDDGSGLPGLMPVLEQSWSPVMRILVVDDSAPFLAVLVHYLRRHPDIEVVGQAYDHFNGLRLVDECRPDLVLVDYSMPMMDGVTFTRLLKSKPNPPKVVLMSFITDGRVQGDALRAGADAFIHKDGIHDQLVPLLQLVLQAEEPAAPGAVEPGQGANPRTGRGLA